MYPANDQNLSYETHDSVYFFSHAFDPLNNWSANAVTISRQTFATLEHAYHYMKFAETAPEIAAEIQVAPSPWAAMQIERKHRDKRRTDWQDVKVAIMTDLVRAKVSQNDDVRDCLEKTRDKSIIENSPWDSFWGAGKDGKGRNMMGQILMQVRIELRRDN